MSALEEEATRVATAAVHHIVVESRGDGILAVMVAHCVLAAIAGMVTNPDNYDVGREMHINEFRHGMDAYSYMTWSLELHAAAKCSDWLHFDILVARAAPSA